MRGVGRSGVVAVLGACGLCAIIGAQANAETLTDALSLAYQTNPTLQSERAQLRALNESYVQARSGFRPQASFSTEFDHTKTPSTLEDEYEAASISLTVNQPIYTGGAVTAEVKAALADILSARQKLRETEAEVLQSVIQAYVDVRRDQEGLRIAQDNVVVLRHQLEETQARFAVGDLTRTDQAQAEARLAQAQSQLANATAQLSISRAGYLAVVGQSPADLAVEPPLPDVPTTIDQAFAAADRNNGGILSADLAEQAAAARVAQAKAANRPTISLRATYGASGVTEVQNPYREFQTLVPGIYDQNLTASAVFTQPLFTGGLNSSRIREALENDNVQRIAVETARRQAVQQISQGWNQLQAASASATADEQQVASDKIAFEGMRQEAQAGLRTTIDVLNAEQELHAAELALVVAHHDQYVASASLLNVMGLLEAKTLLPGGPIYDPAAAFKKVRSSGATPWDGLISTVDGLGSPRIKPMPVTAAQAGGQVIP